VSDVSLVGQVVGRVDHIVYATPDVERTSADLERRFGVQPSPGGQHTGRGTRNILIAIGPACYMEIVGPDPAQEPASTPRWFGIDTLIEPRLVTWAASATDLTRVVKDAARRGVRLGDVSEGRRKRLYGVDLTWEFTDPTVVLGDGLVPFLIDWGASPHPWMTAVVGPRLVDLHGEHPNPERVMGMLEVLGIGMRVTQAAHPSLVATLQTDAGLYELR
jgi:hypothetical protein